MVAERDIDSVAAEDMMVQEAPMADRKAVVAALAEERSAAATGFAILVSRLKLSTRSSGRGEAEEVLC